MEITANVYIKSFSKEGAEEVGVNKITKLLSHYSIEADVYLESASLKVEREYDPDGEPNMEFDCYFTVEVKNANGFTEEEIETIIESNFGRE